MKHQINCRARKEKKEKKNYAGSETTPNIY